MIRGTENLAIGDLISRRVPFVVPVYQRAYAWEDEELGDFISDLQTLYEARVEDPSKPMKHFFGGLVSVDKFATNATGRIYEVVDGQQRLATFLITISLMVRGLKELALQAKQEGDSASEQAAQAHVEQIRRNFLFYDEVEAGQLRQQLRLTLSKADRAFFEKLINETAETPSRESHQRLKLASDKIQSKLIAPIVGDTKTSTKDKLQKLLNLKSSMTDDCNVLHIVSDDRNETYRLFAILNDRGKTLSDGDLLRARTLELLEGHSARQAQVEQYWDKILSGSPTEIEQFLRSYYPSHVGERAPKRDLFDYFCRQFFNYPTTLTLTDVTEAAEVQQFSF